MTSILSRSLLAAVLVAAIAAPRAHAWETTTSVGLAEQAALAGDLDGWLRSLGFSGGMFETLTVPPADAPTLFEVLGRHPPIDGYVPDTRGQQTALAWLLAGAALADATPVWAANHFYDPSTGEGWRAPGRDLVEQATDLANRVVETPARGVAAPDWAASPDNPMGLVGFLDQYEKAIRTATPGERGRHLAGALVAAGAVLHTLGDLGSPTHARGDAAAHRAPMSDIPGDVGARFERLAAIAWGRLGVPAAATIAPRPRFRDYFTSDAVATTAAASTLPSTPGAVGDTTAELGLADWTARHFFSEGTLPRPVDVGRSSRHSLPAALTRSLRRPAPTVPKKQLGMVNAAQARGTALRDATGTCLARYRVERGRLSWWLDDDCELEQAAVILPIAAGYEAALLRWLSRGQLAVASAASGSDAATGSRAVAASARGLALGAGTLTILAEDGRGIRTVVSTTAITSAIDGAALATASVPADARYAIALYRGVDSVGEPVVAVGRLDLP